MTTLRTRIFAALLTIAVLLSIPAHAALQYSTADTTAMDNERTTLQCDLKMATGGRTYQVAAGRLTVMPNIG